MTSLAMDAMLIQLENQLAFQAGAQAANGPPPVPAALPHMEPVPPMPLLNHTGGCGAAGLAAQSRSSNFILQEQQMQRRNEQRQAELSRRSAAARAKEQQQEIAEKQRCHLHTRPNKGCKFCKRFQQFQAEALEKDPATVAGKEALQTAAFSFEDIRNGRVRVEFGNQKSFGFSPLLQSHVIESKHFKETLVKLETFDQLVQETLEYADSVEPYTTSTVDSITPSALFCCLYRFLTVKLDSSQLCRLVENTKSPYVRCVGFLYIRFGLAPEQLWPWLAEFVLDTEHLQLSKDSDAHTTIGEYVESLLIEDKYYSIPLPRLPMSTKRQLETKLAPITQYRKRTLSNLGLTDLYQKRGVRIEANANGTWIQGTTLELVDDAPSRIKVRVKLDGLGEELVPLGKLILTDRRYDDYANTHQRQSRSRSPHIDWTRQKGRSDAQLVDEMRSRHRDKAVATGKDYARKPIGFKKACALPREQGVASYRLMEEETFVSDKYSRRRVPSPEAVRVAAEQRAPSAEHQAKMQQIFEKYGMAKSQEVANRADDMDQSTVLRLG